MPRSLTNLSKVPLIVLAVYFLPVRLLGQVAQFSAPDSVCINAPVNITNMSSGGTTYYWSFCSADLLQTPQAVNLGNLTTLPQEPVFVDIVEENGNYYGLMTIHYPGNLARLDFGNSLLNTPTITFLGNFNGVIFPGFGTEGIQVENVNGNWTAIIVGGSNADNDDPHIFKIDFGSTITNPNPIATDWGNVGGLLYLPIQLYLFQESGLWHGFTVNSEGNTLTRFDFGVDFTNPPTAVSLGNPGGFLNAPTGVTAVNTAGSWHLFISNGAYNLANPVIRLDFGNSLLNTPTVIGLGNLGNVIGAARTLSFIQDCDQTVGFLTDGLNHSLVQLNFNNDILSIPTATSLGNLANWNFPHSLSTLFRVGGDLYSFVPDAFASTLTRLRFPGCTNASVPSSTALNPPAVSYAQPGTYRISLTMDEGLPTQSEFCQSVVVDPIPSFSLGDDTALCAGDSLVLHYNGFTTPLPSYLWQDGSSQDSFTVRGTGKYSLTASLLPGCASASAVQINFVQLPTISTLPNTSICFGTSLQLTTRVSSSDSVQWTPGAGLSSTTVMSPVTTSDTTISYVITAWNAQCPSKDTVQVTVLPSPVVSIMADTLICTGASTQLVASGAVSYSWYPSPGLSDTNVANPVVSPPTSQKYYVKGTDANQCSNADSVQIRIKSPDRFTISAIPKAICPGDSSKLTIAGANPSDGDSYSWLPPASLTDTGDSTIFVSPPTSYLYQVVGVDKICDLTDTLMAEITVLAKPDVSVTKANDINCIYGEAQLTATGGIQYHWSPAQTLSDPEIYDPIARTDTSTLYTVAVTGENGCTTIDTIGVSVTKGPATIGFPLANAFTPNGDGHNDCFGIKYWGYVGTFEMSVYDRWGQRVFYTQNPTDCWDGTYGGKMQPAGTYVYFIKAFALCGEAVRKGTVELIR